MGPDDRNRVLLSAFASKTGRNQPSTAKYIFGPASWLRFLIKPGPGRAICYCDWQAQEVGVAASLSGDPVMQADYRSGDPYLTFAKRVGSVPPDATKHTHAREREMFKSCCSLGVPSPMSTSSFGPRDLERFRLSEAEIFPFSSSHPEKQSEHIKGRFTRGPIPWPWSLKVMELSASA